MKTSKLVIGAVMVFLASQVVAQTTDDNSCGFTQILEKELAEDTVFHRSWMAFEQLLQQHQAMPAQRNEELFTLPIVVHVIHTGEPYGTTANIPDEQIYSSIVALNEDFRKLPGTNGDGIGVDTGIEFCLATRDPQGNPTNGIVRVDGSNVPGYLDAGIRANGSTGAEEIAVKSLSNWPYQDYLNIWVVTQIEGNGAQAGTQGYSRFPVNSIVDGVVVVYNAIGTEGNIKAFTALNRVVTHEVGHYLGLYHTFHSTNSCTPESNCAAQGDRVCDTPQTTYSPPCTTVACGQQMVENYMDYSAQTCMNAFTDGQRTRMRNTIITQRGSLIESLGCTPVSDHDAGITAIFNPVGSTCSPNVSPLVRLTNFGSSPLTACTIHYSTNNETFASYNWTGNLASGSITDVALPSILGIAGSNTFSAWTSDPNGQTDEHPANDEAETSFTVTSGSTVTLNISVDFFGLETTWAIEQNGTVFATGGPFINNAQGTVFTSNVCLPEGCYTLWMYDSFGDGMSFTQGTYSLVNEDGLVLANGGGNFGHEIDHLFCVDAPEEVLPEPPVASFTSSAVAGCGSLTVNFTNNSTGAESYVWSFPGGTPSSSTLANPTVTYNSVGTYNVTLTATNQGGNATSNHPGLIQVNAIPVISLSPSPAGCGEPNGSIAASATGGSGLTYAWNTGQSGANISGLTQGEYTVTVTNSAGCSSQATTNVTATGAPELSIVATSPTCNGTANGTLEALASGGLPPINYMWSNGSTGPEINNLAAGNFTVTATDAAGCVATASHQLTAPSELNVSIFKSDITCNGMQDGSVSATATGGTPPYNYQWAGGANSAFMINLAPGTYSIGVNDANGCQTTNAVQLFEPSAISVTIDNITDESCNGNDGSVIVNAMGGSAPLSISWSSGDLGQLLSGASSGTYTATVTDANNCTSSIECTIGFDCDTTVPTTRLSDEFCGSENLYLHQMIACIPVEGAGMYQWRFQEPESGLIAEGYTNGNNQFFRLDQVSPYLGYGVELTVNIRVLNTDEIWSEWGESCTVKLAEAIPLTQLTSDDCQAPMIQPESSISAQIIAGAQSYEWQFSDGLTTLTAESPLPQITLNSAIGLIEGHVYEVRVRSKVADQWSEFGTACMLHYGQETSVNTVASVAENIRFWPNPSQGEHLFMGYRNLVQGHDVIELEVYDGSGRLVENKTLSITPPHGELTISFRSRLSSGMYFLKARMSGRIFEEKIIIQ